MILTDSHMHSSFSGDCEVAMTMMIQAAIDKGLKTITFTEHHDLEFPYVGINFELDLKAYHSTIQQLKDTYKGQIEILIGIELGMQTHLHGQLSELVHAHEYDFILASSHLANGKDPYDKGFFEGKTKLNAYKEYFEYATEQIEKFDEFDSYAHLDYVIRYWLEEDKAFNYEDLSDVLDKLLLAVIKKEKAIEVNTSGYRYGLGQPHPSYGILKRYHDLGGRRLTIGSDAHRPQDLAHAFSLLEEELKAIGFTGYTLYQQRKPLHISF